MTEKIYEKIKLTKKDNQNQVFKLCGVCGNKRVYNEYHKLNKLCKKCAAKNSAR